MTSERWSRAIIHVDGDAFFASCEQALHPELRGKPLVTGKQRGIISAASYEAKAFGIHRGVPLRDVKRLCPHALIVESDYEAYQRFSERMYAIIRRFTSEVEEYSIDEAFADLTGYDRRWKMSYEAMAQKIKATIEQELGISVSVGLSVSKVLAKVGSKWNKPSGCVVISAEDAPTFLSRLPLEKVWGIGPRTASTCRRFGMQSALDFVKKSESFIYANFSRPFHDLWRELRGEAVFPVVCAGSGTPGSMSQFRTFRPPTRKREELLSRVFKNIESLCFKLRQQDLASARLIVTLRTQSFEDSSMELVFDRPTAYPEDIFAKVKEQFHFLVRPGCLYRATGATFLALVPNPGWQSSLFESEARREKIKRLYQAVDQVNQDVKGSLYLGGTYQARKLSGKERTEIESLPTVKYAPHFQKPSSPL